MWGGFLNFFSSFKQNLLCIFFSNFAWVFLYVYRNMWVTGLAFKMDVIGGKSGPSLFLCNRTVQP